MEDPLAANAWWNGLRHSGMVVSPSVLQEVFASGPSEPPWRDYERLRSAWNRFDAWRQADGTKRDRAPLHEWLDAVLEAFLDHPAERWQKGSHVAAAFRTTTALGEKLYPSRVLLRPGCEGAALLVDVDDEKRIGLGRSKRRYASLLQLLRATGLKLGLQTNGVQFRLVYAGSDHDAWAEWDADAWFAETDLRPRLHGLRMMLGREGMDARDGRDFPLLDAVELSRTKQGELSQVLGEQVRLSVEVILSHVDRAARAHPGLLASLTTRPDTGQALAEHDWLQALYQAATRIVMRVVVALFAEARDMLPRSIQSYYQGYSVEGLFDLLRTAHAHGGGRELEERRYAWPRLLGLFRLIHEGSAHERLPVPAYGGTLFRRGDATATDPVLRALAVFEDPAFKLFDAAVYRILRNLKIGKVRVRQGRSSTWVSGPVDFSDLRTEYIGIMYEGLLDYELRQVTGDQGPVVFLNLGQEPVLPLALVEGMADAALKDLLAKLKKEKAKGPATTEGDAEEDEDDADEAPEEDEAEEEAEADAAPPGEDDEPADDADASRLRAHDWAKRAVLAAGLVRKPKGKKPDMTRYEREVQEKARELIRRVVRPGEMYLVRSSGTRKGTGTFYTRPQLAVPTTHRTLEPLVYEQTEEGRRPRRPEAILSLKVVDPAMGSGSFLVAALRYLTDALYESLLFHKLLAEDPRGSASTSVLTLPYGDPSQPDLREELLPVPWGDDSFEPRVKARLKRHVVERCIYGVDINPMAVELARLSLWVETMDRELPFEFLDHKLKAGNSLVGCWLDRFQDYPAKAWQREAGDKGDDYRAVHFKKEETTKRIQALRGGRVKTELRAWIERRGIGQLDFDTDLGRWPLDDQKWMREETERIHSLPADQREAAYRDLRGHERFRRLRRSFDKWCAVWFWPVGDESSPLPTPALFEAEDADLLATVSALAEELGFFHWELEFPDAFTPQRAGFDGVLGNPPWETIQPETKEFFSRYDPIYRMRGRQEALAVQEGLFRGDPQIERAWIAYAAEIKALAHWGKQAGDPCDMPISGQGAAKLRQWWGDMRERREGYAAHDHPFRHQGSGKAYFQKLFLELAHHLLRDGGRLGFVVPSGVYTDKGTTDLRKLFLEQCRWDWLFGFENRLGIFSIHRSAKFCPVIVERGGSTEAIRAAFMRRELTDWERPDPPTNPVTRDQIQRFSPNTFSIMELKSKREVEIAEKLYAGNPLLGDTGEGKWNVEFRQEFNMTSDSKLFPPIGDWLKKGYAPDGYGRWIGSDGNIALPLYEGRMIGQFDFSQKGWVSGKGRGAKWRDIPWNAKVIEPQFLMAAQTARTSEKWVPGLKTCYMRVGSPTNTRTVYATCLRDVPCGDKVPVIGHGPLSAGLSFEAVLNSFVLDFIARRRCAGLQVDYHFIEHTPVVKAPWLRSNALARYGLSLEGVHHLWSPDWLRLRAEYSEPGKTAWQKLWAVDLSERLRLRCIVDAIVAELYGLDHKDMEFILRNDPDDPVGFWRVDKDIDDYEMRQTGLTLRAFRDMKEMGLDAFLAADWQLPKEARAFHDARQDYTWTPTETWADCEQHARNMMTDTEWSEFQKELAQLARKRNNAEGDR